MNKYTQRLYNEWLEHKKIIVALDFDDTISPWGFKTEEDQKDFDRVIKVVQNAYNIGAYVVIWTASAIERYPEIQQYCEDKKIPISCINENPIPLPYGHNKKIFANVFIDDRAGINETLNMLEEIIDKINSQQQPYTT